MTMREGEVMMDMMMDACMRLGCQEFAETGGHKCGSVCLKMACRLMEEKAAFPARTRNTAGVATMARLMQRTRDERDFGGAVDDDV
jgi:hypothetical protein